MKPVYPLKAQARIVAPDAGRHLAQIASHLEHHGAIATLSEGRALLDFEFSRGIMRMHGGDLILSVEAADRSLLHEIKQELAEHVCEFTGIDAVRILWDGDASDALTPPNFRILTVVATSRITPHMQRIRFSAHDLLRFSGMRNLHCKLLIPPEGQEPQWPFLDDQGSFRWPSGPGKPTVRKYTIRSVDVDRGTLDIDMVVHEDGGPGSAFAVEAKPGDRIGMIGPGGRGVLQADWYLLAGDETGLPAIARVLENLPQASRGLALIEVADRSEEQDISAPDGFEIVWLHRDRAAPGAHDLLADAVRNTGLPKDAGKPFVWAGCEFAAFRQVRAHVRKVWKLPAEQHLVTSYWRRGFSEDGKDRLDAVMRLLPGA